MFLNFFSQPLTVARDRRITASDADIEQSLKTLLAIRDDIYTISPSGGHIAYMGAKGTHFAVTVDGVEGPMFDELYGPNGQGFHLPEKAAVMRSSPGGEKADAMVPVLFSPDGAHYAYAARLGAEYVVIHDGQETGRGPRARPRPVRHREAQFPVHHFH